MIPVSLSILAALSACSPKSPEVLEPAPFALPDPGEAPSYTPPVPQVRTLESGATLWVIEDHLLPLVSTRIIFDGGARLEAGGHWGETALLADLMDEAAGDYAAADFSKALRLLAADLYTGGTRDSLEIALDCHAERLDEAMALAADVALRPALDAGDWARIKDQHINDLRRRSEDASEVATYLATLRYHGEDHPWGRPVQGTVSSVEGLELSDMERAWRANVQPERATFVVVGDVDVDAVAGLIDERFDVWPEPVGGEEAEAPARWSEERPGAGQVLLLDMPGATQTAIRIVTDGYADGDAEAAGARLANVALGGSFTSRLNRLLRSELGYTYGAFTSFARRRGATTWYFSSSVRADATADALTRTLDQIRAMADGFSEEELAKARSQIGSDAVSSVETRASQAASLAALARLALPPDATVAELEADRAADIAQLQAAAARYWDTEEMMILLVGDESLIGSSLEDAGYAYTVIEEPG